MAAGDKEILEAFEETTRRNVEAAISFSNETRNIVRGLEERVQRMEDQIRSRENEVVRLQNMITHLQTQVFAGGTSGD